MLRVLVEPIIHRLTKLRCSALLSRAIIAWSFPISLTITSQCACLFSSYVSSGAATLLWATLYAVVLRNRLFCVKVCLVLCFTHHLCHGERCVYIHTNKRVPPISSSMNKHIKIVCVLMNIYVVVVVCR